MSADQQRDDTPLTEDAEKDRENPSELCVENVVELKHSKARAKTACIYKGKAYFVGSYTAEELTLDAIQEGFGYGSGGSHGGYREASKNREG